MLYIVNNNNEKPIFFVIHFIDEDSKSAEENHYKNTRFFYKNTAYQNVRLEKLENQEHFKNN